MSAMKQELNPLIQHIIGEKLIDRLSFQHATIAGGKQNFVKELEVRSYYCELEGIVLVSCKKFVYGNKGRQTGTA